MVGNVPPRRVFAVRAGPDQVLDMDIAGPKLRTEAVICDPADARLFPGARFRLVAHGAPHTGDGIAVAAGVSAPEIVTRLRVGDRVSYDDGKIGGDRGACRRRRSGHPGRPGQAERQPDQAGKGPQLPRYQPRAGAAHGQGRGGYRHRHRLCRHGRLFLRQPPGRHRSARCRARPLSPRGCAAGSRGQDRAARCGEESAGSDRPRHAARAIRRDDRARRSRGGTRFRAHGGNAGRDPVDLRSRRRSRDLGDTGPRRARQERGCPRAAR